jgi:23S rRNA (cytidine1920-2'-O)/16S rRNA (cytidine1409-2'-O)-methyltransferase
MPRTEKPFASKGCASFPRCDVKPRNKKKPGGRECANTRSAGRPYPSGKYAVPRRSIRLIELLTSLYPARSEKELFAEILRGDVLVAGQKVMKPGTRVPADAEVSIREKPPYVSRGGEKLAAALDLWGIECGGKTWIDAGCSTGGFTDCLLRRGASLVYAVDVGENQLNWRLRADPRVRVMESTNIMAVRPEALDPPPTSAVADLSFRSIRKAASRILGLTAEKRGIFLVKPQFEYTDPPRDFRGVVQGQDALRAIIIDLVAGLEDEGVGVEDGTESPLRGRKGNREFLFLLRLGGDRRGMDRDALLRKLLLE